MIRIGNTKRRKEMARLKQWFEKKSAAKKELKNRKPGSKLLAVEDGKLGFFLGGEGPVKQILKKFTAKVIASAPEGKVKTRKVKKVRKVKKIAKVKKIKVKKSAHRGRPKGSKNLKKTARKGRPKGSKNLVKLVKCPCCGEKVNPNRIPIRFSK